MLTNSSTLVPGHHLRGVAAANIEVENIDNLNVFEDRRKVRPLHLFLLWHLVTPTVTIRVSESNRDHLEYQTCKITKSINTSIS